MSAESNAFNLQHQVRNNANELQDYMRELDNWERDVKKKDQSLSTSKSILKPYIPPVRSTTTKQHKKQQEKNPKKEEKKRKKEKIPGYDYSAWDKLDVEGALQDMDSSSESETLLESDGSEKEDEAHQRQRAEAERQIGNEHFKAQKYGEAVEHYSRAIRMDPNQESALTNRAMAFIKTEKYAAADKDCDTVIAMNPHNVKALYRRGLARYNLGSYEIAKVDFLDCLEIEPDNQPAKDFVHKINVKLNPELEGRFQPVDKPEHLMSKKPLVKVKIEEVGSGSGSESDDDSEVAKSNTEVMSEIFETQRKESPPRELKVEQKPISSTTPPKSPPRPITIPTAPTTNSSQFINNWKTLKKEPELFFKYFQSIPPPQYPKLLVQFLENDGLPHLLHLFNDFYIPNNLTYLEELQFITEVPRFNVATMFLSKEDKHLCQQLLSRIQNPATDLSALAKLYDTSLH